MRVEWAADGRGELQFIIHAETREERALLRVFRKQHESPGERFFVHGWTWEGIGSGGAALGPTSFNFGTVPVTCRMCATVAAGGGCTCAPASPVEGAP